MVSPLTSAKSKVHCIIIYHVFLFIIKEGVSTVQDVTVTPFILVLCIKIWVSSAPAAYPFGRSQAAVVGLSSRCRVTLELLSGRCLVAFGRLSGRCCVALRLLSGRSRAALGLLSVGCQVSPGPLSVSQINLKLTENSSFSPSFSSLSSFALSRRNKTKLATVRIF